MRCCWHWGQWAAASLPGPSCGCPVARWPGCPRRLRQPLAPARLVLEHEPCSPEGGLPLAACSLCHLQAPLLSPLPSSRLPLTSPRHINIRRQMLINLFSAVLQLPLLTACRVGGPGEARMGRGSSGNPSRGASLPLALEAVSPAFTESECCLLHERIQVSVKANGLPPTGGKIEPGLAPNPRSACLSHVEGTVRLFRELGNGRLGLQHACPPGHPSVPS